MPRASSPISVGITGVLMPSIMLLGFVILLAYAVVRDQVFGIELVLKDGIRRGLIVAPFTITLFVVSELLEGAIPFDSTLAGILAAAAIALFFAPIQRGAARLVDRLMPDVSDSPEYRQRRAEEVYAAARQAAMADGALTEKDRRILSTLAAQLNVRPETLSADDADTALPPRDVPLMISLNSTIRPTCSYAPAPA